MFEPAFHYLIESFRVCAHVTDLSVNEVVFGLLLLVGLFTGLVVLRSRVRR
jgi:hypothetical protein